MARGGGAGDAEAWQDVGGAPEGGPRAHSGCQKVTRIRTRRRALTPNLNLSESQPEADESRMIMITGRGSIIGVNGAGPGHWQRSLEKVARGELSLIRAHVTIIVNFQSTKL